MDGKVRMWGPIAPPRRGAVTPPAGRTPEPGQPSFQEVLRSRMHGELRFSAHARARLVQRGIRFGEADLGQVRDALDRAEQKGIRSSLVLSPKAALVVNVASSTAITAVAPTALDGAVFSSIDGAVFVDQGASSQVPFGK